MATFRIPTNPPYFPNTNFNPAFNNAANTSNQSVQDLLPYFLSYPQAQGKMTLLDTTITGDLILTSSSTFNTSTNLILDSSSNYIQFGDNTRQYTAPSADDPNTVYNDISNTFFSPTIQTFQGSNLSNGTNAPLQFSNVSSGEFGSLFVDPNPNTDLTLYSNQNTGGLTVSNINGYSFTVNPIIGNVANFKNPISSDFGISGASLNVNNTVIFPNSQSTAISNTSLVSTNPNIYFALNDASNNQVAPLQIYYNSIQYNVNLNMNNNPIYNISSLQIGTGTNTYTQLVQGGSTFGINNLYPSSSSPQISLAVKNLSESLQGLTVTSSGVNLSTQLNMGNYNIINLGNISGSSGALVTTTTPLNNDITTAIATTGYVITSIANISNITTASSTITNQSGINPATFTWSKESNTVLKTVKFNLNQPATTSSAGGFAWNFTLSFNTSLYPTGAVNPTIQSGSYLSPFNTQYNIAYPPLQISIASQTTITVSSGGTSNYLNGNENFTGYIYIAYS